MSPKSIGNTKKDGNEHQLDRDDRSYLFPIAVDVHGGIGLKYRGWSGRAALILTRLLIFLVLLPVFSSSPAVSGAPRQRDLQRHLLLAAANLLEEAKISYVYGGFQVGDSADCKRCNDCLAAKKPVAKQRLAACAVCQRCSLDCSHFTELVYRQAGAPYPYLDTATMLSLPASRLLARYKLLDLGTDLDRLQAGDLLVYRGHVVMLERTHAPQPDLARYRGDIVHATGGKDVRGPGEGIQRERFVDLTYFRGPLQRILRHVALEPDPVVPSQQTSSPQGSAKNKP